MNDAKLQKKVQTGVHFFTIIIGHLLTGEFRAWLVRQDGVRFGQNWDYFVTVFKITQYLNFELSLTDNMRTLISKLSSNCLVNKKFQYDK